MEKPKNLYVLPMDMNSSGGVLVVGGYRVERNKGDKNVTKYIDNIFYYQKIY